MNRVLKLQLLCGLFLMSWFSMGMDSSVPVAPKGRWGLSSIARAGSTTLSYVSPALKISLDFVRRYSARAVQALQPAVNFAKQHSAPVVKAVQPALNFVGHQSRTTKWVAGTVAAVGAGFVAGRAIKRWIYPQTEKRINGFQDALTEWFVNNGAYEQQVIAARRYLNFLVPAVIGLRMLHEYRVGHVALGRAAVESLAVAGGIFNYMHGLFELPGDYAARFLSHIPSPAFLNPLRVARVRAEKALQNVRKIIREQDIQMDDLKDFERSHIIKDDRVRVQFRNYIREQENQPPLKPQKALQAWIGGVPGEVQASINSIRDDIMHDIALKDGHLNLDDDQYHDSMPRGLFLLGAPGLGKSLLVQHIGLRTGCYVKVINGTKFMKKYVGEAGDKLRSSFAKVRAKAKETGKPCILFIDEADAILEDRERGNNEGGARESKNEIINTLLPLMDSPVGAKDDIITIFASNRPKAYFEGALRNRSERIKYWIEMPYPNGDTCLQMLQQFAHMYPQTRRFAVNPVIENDPLTRIAQRQDEAIHQIRPQGGHVRLLTPDTLKGIIKLAVDIAKDQAGQYPDDFNEEQDFAIYDARQAAIVTPEMLMQAFNQKYDELPLLDPANVRVALAEDYQPAGVDGQAGGGDGQGEGDAHADQPVVGQAAATPVVAGAHPGAQGPHTGANHGVHAAAHQVQPGLTIPEIFQQMVQQNQRMEQQNLQVMQEHQTLLQILQRVIPVQVAPAGTAVQGAQALHHMPFDQPAAVGAPHVGMPVSQVPVVQPDQTVQPQSFTAALRQHVNALEFVPRGSSFVGSR